MTNAQKWARKRNFSKFVIHGMYAQLRSLRLATSVLTSDEECAVIDMEYRLDDIIKNWKEQTPTSKRMYVKED